MNYRLAYIGKYCLHQDNSEFLDLNKDFFVVVVRALQVTVRKCLDADQHVRSS